MPAPRLIAAAGLAAALLPAAASAKPSLWDLFTPERIVTRVVQFAIAGLRTQVDVTYGGISVSPLTGTVTLTDIRMWPVPPWMSEGTCQVDIGRLTIRTAAVDEVDVVRLKMQATGASAPVGCLPPEAQGATAMLGLDSLNLGRLTIDLDYRISTASAVVHSYTRADDLAAVTVLADLDYFSLDAREDVDRPKPVVYVRQARVTVENLGLWEKAQGMVPPPFTDPATAGEAVGQVVAEAIPMTGPEVDALRASAVEAFTAFLADPKMLVLETGFDPASPVWLDPDQLEAGPEPLLTMLQPRFASRSAPSRAILPAALIQKADTPDAMTGDERLAAGLAFASGVGAPRDVETARVLLTPLADAGNGDAAAALARALETRAPQEAYGYALTASAAAAEGSGALLDRIEAGLPFDTVLAEQAKKVEGVQHPAEALESLALVRAEAAKRLTGRGETRSYATAALWALIGSAAGDAESADILEEIDERVRIAGPEALAAWAPQEADAVALARQAWVGFDLPATFGGVN